MRITDFVRIYAQQTTIEKGTEYQYFQAAQALERWANRPVEVADFCDELVNQWLLAMVGNCLAPATASSRRKHILALWRAAHWAGLVGVKPGLIRRVKVPWKAPEAWTIDEVRAIVKATRGIRGWFPWNGVSRADWWNALIRMEWDTALRTCDLLSVPIESLGEDGLICVTQQKTGYWFTVRVHQQTRHRLLAVTSQRPKCKWVIGWRASGESFRRQFSRLVRSAGLTGSFKKLRKSSASNVELHHPGCGAAHLGHARSIATDHYFDPRIIGSRSPMPEEL